MSAREQWARAERQAAHRALEELLAMQLRAAGLHHGCWREYRFDDERRWRLDFAYPDRLLAIEVHGGTFIQGGHSRGARQRQDFDKQNALAFAGWRLLVFDTTMVRDGTAVRTIERWFNERKDFSWEFLPYKSKAGTQSA